MLHPKKKKKFLNLINKLDWKILIFVIKFQKILVTLEEISMVHLLKMLFVQLKIIQKLKILPIQQEKMKEYGWLQLWKKNNKTSV